MQTRTWAIDSPTGFRSEIHVRSIPCIKRLSSDTAMHVGATKSASDRRHGSPRRTVRIRLDIGGGSGGVWIGDLSEGPGCDHHRSAKQHRLLKLSSPKQDCQIVSPRLPQMASLPRQPAASTPQW